MLYFLGIKNTLRRGGERLRVPSKLLYPYLSGVLCELVSKVGSSLGWIPSIYTSLCFACKEPPTTERQEKDVQRQAEDKHKRDSNNRKKEKEEEELQTRKQGGEYDGQGSGTAGSKSSENG